MKWTAVHAQYWFESTCTHKRHLKPLVRQIICLLNFSYDSIFKVFFNLANNWWKCCLSVKQLESGWDAGFIRRLIRIQAVWIWHNILSGELTLSPLAVNFEDRWWPLQTIWDPNCLKIQIIYQQKNGWKQCFFLKILKETNIWKNYPACKELRVKGGERRFECSPTYCRYQGRHWPTGNHVCC